MADVFISYSRANETVVRGLAEAVACEGYSVWWDEALPPHLSYSDVITGEIGAAKAVIVVWSERAIASEWVRAEADLARNQKKLVQTSIDGRMPPMPFNQLHFVSIGDWRGEADHPGWTRVKESLAALCRGEVTRAGLCLSSGRTAAARAAASAGRQSGAAAGADRDDRIVGSGAVAAAFWLSPSRREPRKAPSRGRARRCVATKPARTTPAVAASPDTAREPAPTRTRTPTGPIQPQIANMRRYCSGPGRGTPQCRQFRARHEPESMMRAVPGLDRGGSVQSI